MALTDSSRQELLELIEIVQEKLPVEDRLTSEEIGLSIEGAFQNPANISADFGQSCEESLFFKAVSPCTPEEVEKIEAAYGVLKIDLWSLWADLGFSNIDGLYKQLCLMLVSSDDSYLKQAIGFGVSRALKAGNIK